MTEALQVLIVSADPIEQRMLTVSLRKKNFDVLYVSSGQAALDSLMSLPSIAVALIDLELPDMSGLLLCEHIRAEPSLDRASLIALSENRDLPIKLRAYELGFDEVLNKPIFIKEVAARVQIQIEQQLKTRMLEASTQLIEGELGELGVIDLLQSIEASRRSGRATLHEGERRGHIYFSKGEIIDADVGRLRGLSALYSLALWAHAQYSILNLPKSRRRRRINSRTSEMVVDILERIEAWDHLQKQLPSLVGIYEVDYDYMADALSKLSSDARQTLKLFDGIRTLGDALADAKIDELRTSEAILQLFRFNILFVIEAVETLDEDPNDFDDLPQHLGSTSDASDEYEGDTPGAPLAAVNPPQRTDDERRDSGKYSTLMMRPLLQAPSKRSKPLPSRTMDPPRRSKIKLPPIQSNKITDINPTLGSFEEKQRALKLQAKSEQAGVLEALRDADSEFAEELEIEVCEIEEDDFYSLSLPGPNSTPSFYFDEHGIDPFEDKDPMPTGEVSIVRHQSLRSSKDLRAVSSQANKPLKSTSSTPKKKKSSVEAILPIQVPSTKTKGEERNKFVPTGPMGHSGLLSVNEDSSAPEVLEKDAAHPDDLPAPIAEILKKDPVPSLSEAEEEPASHADESETASALASDDTDLDQGFFSSNNNDDDLDFFDDDSTSSQKSWFNFALAGGIILLIIIILVVVFSGKEHTYDDEGSAGNGPSISSPNSSPRSDSTPETKPLETAPAASDLTPEETKPIDSAAVGLLPPAKEPNEDAWPEENEELVALALKNSGPMLVAFDISVVDGFFRRPAGSAVEVIPPAPVKPIVKKDPPKKDPVVKKDPPKKDPVVKKDPPKKDPVVKKDPPKKNPPKKVAKKDPPKAKASGGLKKGEAAYKARKYADAISLLSKHIAQKPGDKKALYLLGMSYAKSRKAAQAVKYLEKVKGSHSKNVGYWKTLGSAYIRLKQTSKAIGAYEQALKILGPASAKGQKLQEYLTKLKG